MPNFAIWSASDKGANIVLSGANLSAGSTSTGWQSVRTDISKSSGKWVFELTRTQINNQALLGFGDASFSIANYLGASAKSVGMQGGTGYLANGITTAGTIDPNVLIYMFAIDIDAGKGWIQANGVWANSGNPSNGTNPSFIFTSNMQVFPAATVTSDSSQTVTLNSGQSAFNQSVPVGFNSGWFDVTNPAIAVILNTRRDL